MPLFPRIDDHVPSGLASSTTPSYTVNTSRLEVRWPQEFPCPATAASACAFGFKFARLFRA